MLPELHNFYFKKPEPVKSYLLYLRDHILQYNPNITEAWKYRMPMFLYKGKMFCYLWIEKKSDKPYLGIVEGKNIDHPQLIQADRSRMKILLFEPEEDIPLETINLILDKAIVLYD